MLRAISLAGAVALAALTGCYPEPVVGYASVTSAPPAEIETSPSVVYEGRPVYYYGDRWWYRDGGQWAYYSDEPEELHRRRAYVQVAPPAARPERREHMEYREAAPRAERVR